MKRAHTGDAGTTRHALADAEAGRTFDTAELSKEFDISFRAIRLYEEKGLIHPRRSGQTRIFSETDRQRLKLVLDAKQMGFSLMQIAELLPKRSSSEMTLALDAATIRSQIEELVYQREQIAKGLAALNQLYDQLNQGVEKVSGQKSKN